MSKSQLSKTNPREMTTSLCLHSPLRNGDEADSRLVGVLRALEEQATHVKHSEWALALTQSHY